MSETIEQTWEQELLAMGEARGKVEGRLIACKENLRALLEERFGPLPLELGERIEATTDLERALNLNAQPAVVHYNLALVCSAQKNRDAALAHVRKALQHEPGNKDAQVLLKKLTGRP